MMREPLDWDKTPQSSGLTFEGSVDRLRFAASTPKSNRRAPSQITTGFKDRRRHHPVVAAVENRNRYAERQ